MALDWRGRVRAAATVTVIGALWPGRMRPDRWREKRSVLRHLATTTTFLWLARELGHRARIQREEIEATLRERLGREPTSDEVSAEFNTRYGSD